MIWWLSQDLDRISPTLSGIRDTNTDLMIRTKKIGSNAVEYHDSEPIEFETAEFIYYLSEKMKHILFFVCFWWGNKLNAFF